jgi:hypothetical protein
MAGLGNSTSRNLHSLFKWQAMNDRSGPVFDVDTLTKPDLSFERIRSNNGAGLTQCPRDDCRHIDQNLAFRVQQDVFAVAKVKIIEWHNDPSHAFRRERGVSQPPGPKISPGDSFLYRLAAAEAM